VIREANDDPDSFQRLIDWILTEIGCDVPIHFTAFHPDFQMRDISSTPGEILSLACDTAVQTGFKYA
jgi:pyruvate formate lyase activating enzyme